jgi:hypothetical protein
VKATLRANLSNAWLGVSTQSSGEQKLHALRQAERAAPGNAAVLMYLGRYYEETGDAATAERYYVAVLAREDADPVEARKVRPMLAALYVRWGDRLAASGDVEGSGGAREFWRRAALTDPAGEVGDAARARLRR